MHRLFAVLTRNPLSLIGTTIATASAALFITFFAIEIVGFHGSPYLGIMTYLVFPGLFLTGLLMIPAGMAWRWWRGKKLVTERALPVLDLNSKPTQRMIVTFLALTFINVVVLATASYKGVEVMDSTAFCGTTCHSVMIPEYTAYQRSPHARVNCVDCHIGPGANWFVKSKLSGAWQLVSVAFDLYPRPIPTPVHNLRPSRDTCEQCHWPTKFVGDKLRVLTHYADDEENTELKTVLLLRVGGIQGRESQGIHWHVDPGNRIRYRADETREIIGDVELTRPDGTVVVYHSEADEEIPEESEWREMDCIDCHNRPTHVYRQPDDEIDTAIQEGRIDRSLPYVRREGLRLLQGDYDSHEAARTTLRDGLRAFYEESHPELAATHGELIADAGDVLGEIYTLNVFPAMKVQWGTYPDHIGHTDSPGCFRCHDEEHETEAGETISQDCFECHSLLAMEEEDPEILAELQP